MPTMPPVHRAHAKAETRRQYDEARGNSHARGYGRRWQRFRLAILAERPLCEACMKQGRTEAATDVDHVVPVQGANDPRFYVMEEVQALCHMHHSIKTVTQDGGFGRGTMP